MGNGALSPFLPRRRILNLPLSPLSSSVSHQSSEGKGGERESALVGRKEKRTFWLIVRLLMCHCAIVQSRHYKNEVCGLGKCVCVYVFSHCCIVELPADFYTSCLYLKQAGNRGLCACFIPSPPSFKSSWTRKEQKGRGKLLSLHLVLYVNRCQIGLILAKFGADQNLSKN